MSEEKIMKKVVEYDEVKDFKDRRTAFFYGWGVMSIVSLIIISIFNLISYKKFVLEKFLFIELILATLIVLANKLMSRNVYWKEVDSDD